MLTIVTIFLLIAVYHPAKSQKILAVDSNKKKDVRALEPILRQKCPNLAPIGAFSRYLLSPLFTYIAIASCKLSKNL